MPELLYFTDPMCSWCWGFAPELATIEAWLAATAPEVRLRYVMGGLAPDAAEPMPEEMRSYVRHAWRAVEARTGARFEHRFWDVHTPRRSTWPACRAVLAAGDRAREMFEAIQRAYYLEVRDPSDRATLEALGSELGLGDDFGERIDAPETRALLDQHFALRDRLGVTGYPTLALVRGDEAHVVSRGWVAAGQARAALEALLRGA